MKAGMRARLGGSKLIPVPATATSGVIKELQEISARAGSLTSGRKLAPKSVQVNAAKLHNRGNASQDFQSFTDSHARIKIIAMARLAANVMAMRTENLIPKDSNVTTRGALFHTLTGTIENPFIHALPALPVVNGIVLADIPRGEEWINEIIDICHTGIMAPDNYKDLGYEGPPKYLNHADMSTERSGSVKNLQSLVSYAVGFDGGDPVGFFSDMMMEWRDGEVQVIDRKLSEIGSKYKDDPQKQGLIANSHASRIKFLKTMDERLPSYHKYFFAKVEGLRQKEQNISSGQRRSEEVSMAEDLADEPTDRQHGADAEREP